jgi:CheY-like chemotaxis protein
MGHRVWSASSGERALALLEGEAQDVDLVVTDQAMPGMTGVDMARCIRDRRPDLSIILATGYAELPDGAAAVIDERLSKPFLDGDLGQAIARARARTPSGPAPS